MATFLGDYEQTIDSKRRLPITSALREWIDAEQDGTNFIAMLVGPEKDLWLYPDQYCRRLLKTMKRSQMSNEEHRRIGMYFARARLLKCDSQGRVVLPEKLMRQAGLEKEVVLLGVDDHIEVWPAEKWTSIAESEPEDVGGALMEASRRMEMESSSQNREQ